MIAQVNKRPDLLLRYGLLLAGAAELMIWGRASGQLGLLLLLVAGFMVVAQLRFFHIGASRLSPGLHVLMLGLLPILYIFVGQWPWLYSIYALRDLIQSERRRVSLPLTLLFLGAQVAVMVGEAPRAAGFTVLALGLASLLMAEGRVANVRTEELERQLLATRRKLEQVSKQLDSQRHALDSLQELYTLRERNRISREIHDAVGHRLSAIVIQLGAFEQVAGQEHPQLAQLAGELRTYAAESLTDVRQIIADLRPRQLESKQLLPALEELTQSFRTTSQVQVDLAENISGIQLTEQAELAIYRAVQEFLSNAVRHGEASQIRIRLHWAHAEDTLIVSLRDNGIGTSHIVPHQGLSGIAERIAELGGELDLQSAPGEGFFARLTLPLPKRDEED